MNKLKNKEIARVFAMYLGAAVICDGRECELECLNVLDLSCDLSYKIDDEESGFYGEWTTEQFEIFKAKLILTPLSKITDEHAMACWEIENYMCSEQDIPYVSNLFKEMSGNLFQYLIQQGYAVPLFFTPNHWANGKTAIELGIAIESL